MDELDCIDACESACRGEVFNRLSRTGATRSPRCERHYAEYAEQTDWALEEINRRYPDSPMAPAWFDPTYAGESWDYDY